MWAGVCEPQVRRLLRALGRLRLLRRRLLLATAVVPLDEDTVQDADDRRQDRSRAERHMLEAGLQRLDVDLAVGPKVRPQRAQPDADARADDHLDHRGPDRLRLPGRATGDDTDDGADDRARDIRQRAGRPAEAQQAVADARTDDQSLDEPNDD